MTKREAKAAILAAIPALLLAGSAWIQADAAKRSDAKTYESAAETIGSQSDEILALQTRVSMLERYAVAHP